MFHTSTTVVVTGAHSLTFQRDLMNFIPVPCAVLFWHSWINW